LSSAQTPNPIPANPYELVTGKSAAKPMGSFRPASETKTTLLRMGEPQASVFDIPPGQVEMKPSAAMRRLMESLDLCLNAEQRAAMLNNFGAASEYRKKLGLMGFAGGGGFVAEVLRLCSSANIKV
jgi:hypothetical protein